MRAKFLKDADVWGKQDPFVQFRYNGKMLKTSVKAGAGKEATWNEEFTLDNIGREIAAGGKLRLEALDDDTMSDDWIGATMPLAYSEMVTTSDKVMRKLEFLDKAGREIGHVNISTQYIRAEGAHASPRTSYVGSSHGHVVSDGHAVVRSHHSPERIVTHGHITTGRDLTENYIRPAIHR